MPITDLISRSAQVLRAREVVQACLQSGWKFLGL